MREEKEEIKTKQAHDQIGKVIDIFNKTPENLGKKSPLTTTKKRKRDETSRNEFKLPELTQRETKNVKTHFHKVKY